MVGSTVVATAPRPTDGWIDWLAAAGPGLFPLIVVVVARGRGNARDGGGDRQDGMGELASDAWMETWDSEKRGGGYFPVLLRLL